MKDKITCFLPCRKGSERVPNKNIKPFAEFKHGLFEVKLKQLCSCQRLDKIIISTNDEEILKYADSINNPRVILCHRSDELSSNQTSTDDLIMHAFNLISEGHILWTHVTSPFVTNKYYDQIILKYFEMLNYGFDSLMTTTPIHGYFWDNAKPINYNPSIEKWPRTQTLLPLNEVNSAVFLAPAIIYNIYKDRIGIKPYLYSMDKLISLDIDWPEDFALAECMIEKNIVSV